VNFRTFIIFIIVVLCVHNNAWAKAKFKAPPRSTVEWVSPESRVEGMELKIRRFEAVSLSVDDVLKFYRKEWKDLAAELDVPPWKMIGTKQRKEYWNVQIQKRAAGGVWGYLSVSDLPDLIDQGKPFGANAEGVKGNGGQGFPKMSGSTVINDFAQRDIGRKGRTLLIQNDFSVSSNASFYRSHYENRGYRSTIDQGDSGRGSHVLFMNKGNEQVSVTINQLQGKTSITANEVSNGF